MYEAQCEMLQVQEDCPGDLARWYRHISKGAWPFSSRDHGWPIADCSAEGLKVRCWVASSWHVRVLPSPGRSFCKQACGVVKLDSDSCL